MKRIFISGSDTEVGKTFFTVQLLRKLKSANVAGFKPIACGDRDDAQKFLDAMAPTSLVLDEINPIFLQKPMAPYVAATAENRTLDFDRLDKSLKKLEIIYSTVLIEGAGGIMTPITSNLTMRDLARRWDCSVVLVVPNQLGVLSQTLCAVEALQDLVLEGIILNNREAMGQGLDLQRSNQEVLLEHFPGKVWNLNDCDLTKFAERFNET
ncbi:MAG: dethiobiotin synthase [Verrucomicrobiae bacterium]|nr:dethiobiotin synthase [Verrucomicrobiae bacterium]